MNRGEHRQTALDLVSWHADVDDDFVTEVNRGIELAYKRVAAEVPEALIPDIEHVSMIPDYTSTTLGRTLANTDDEYVLTFGVTGSANPVIDGTWDGVMHLEIDYNGGIIRRQCREFWQHKSGTYLNHYVVSLDRPINFSGQSGLTFRLFQPYVYTRDNVKRILDGRLFNATRQQIRILPADFIRRMGWEDYHGESPGPPIGMAPGQRFQLPAPSRTPTITTHASDNWIDGQEAPGTFKYRYTYVWGKRSAERQSPRGSYDPMWESAPSPESASATVAAVGSDALVVNMVNIAWQLGFDPDPATLRSGRSGLRKRIYRARTASTAGGTAEDSVETDGVYYFLAEVGDEVETYTDDGSDIPEYDRRLPESHGYWSWAFSPHQDQAYEIDLRVLRNPIRLQVDTDSPNLDPAFEHLLTALTCKHLCRMGRDPEQALIYETEYTSWVGDYRDSQANLSNYVPGVPWTPGHTYAHLDYVYGPYTSS